MKINFINDQSDMNISNMTIFLQNLTKGSSLTVILKIEKYKIKFRKRDNYPYGIKENFQFIVEVGKNLPNPTVGAKCSKQGYWRSQT